MAARSKRSWFLAVGMPALLASSSVQAQIAANVVMNPPLTTAEIPAQKPGEHRIWVNDYANGFYARAMLFNADTGELLGTTDTGWEGEKIEIPATGQEFYNAGLFMSRGFRGARVDAIEIMDKATFELKGEIVVPGKAIRGWPNPNHTSLTDDDRFMLMQFFTPASSVGIVDLQARKYVGEIETAGCANIMHSGARRFFVLCGDGSALEIVLDENGNEALRKRHAKLFDADKDPLHETGMRSGDIWYMISHLGVVRAVDVSGDRLRFLPQWSISEAEGDKRWIPAQIIQNIGVHAATGELYVLMHLTSLAAKGGGTDYHRSQGTEVWVFDIKTHTRLRRIKLPRAMDAIAVSQDTAPRLYASTFWTPLVQVLDAQSGEALRTLDSGVTATPGILQPIEPR